MITLYFNWNAVCAMKVALCLAEKNLPYQERHIVLSDFAQLEPEYLKINPAGVVPSLTDGDAVVLESTVINEYLDDAYPATPLRPREPAALARMRWWAKQVDDVVHPSIRPLSFTRFVAPRAQSLSPQQLADLGSRTPKAEIAELWRRAAEAPYTEQELAGYLKKIHTLLLQMEETLQASPWLAGPEFSLADIAMAPYFRRLTQLEKQDLWSGLPAVAAWWKAITARPSFARLDDLRRRYAPADHPAANISA